MEIIKNIKSLFISPRFISFYWRTGAVSLVGLISLVLENISNLGLPTFAVVIIGLLLGEATKALSNYVNEKPLGFSVKK